MGAYGFARNRFIHGWIIDYINHLWLQIFLFSAELYAIIYFMSGKKTKGERNSNRQNGKANKKSPKIFDPVKRRLVAA